MSLSIDSLCPIDLDKIGVESEQISITSDDLSNSACLFNSLVCQSIKLLKTSQTKDDKPLKIFMILFNQTYNEISRYQMKNFGLNLKSFKDVNQLIVMDFLTDYKDGIVTSDGSILLPALIQKTLDKIKQTLSSEDDSSKAIVLVDDVSCLLILGLPLNQVYQYCRHLRNLIHYHKLVLIMQSYYDYDEDDTDINRLCQSFIETCNIWLQCKHLDTGFSSKVDGNLIINDYHQWPTKTHHYHFKRMPRNVKVLPVGAFS
uniref:Elongator complex protein 6 n=1 Tax=Tetranychus urticae TaxID=32264 RepID=T1KHB8_TETUR